MGRVDIAAQAAGIGALADATRRSLYEYVVAQDDAVGREQAATALGLTTSTASFHLDRLATEGLLDVEYRRLTGRTGPGAGRPSKLYRRAAREFAVSLPERRYDLVGEILAAAFDRAAEGEDLDRALETSAHTDGLRVGEGSRAAGAADDLGGLAGVLTAQGYEARITDADDGAAVELANCPFDALAKQHTALVCGLNQHFVQGVADGLGCGEARACLEPQAGMCCVKVHHAKAADG